MENIVPESVLRAVIRGTASPQNDMDATLAKALKNLRAVVSIGAAKGTIEQTFSRIVDAALTDGGDYLVLDRTLAALRVFDRQGQFKHEVRASDISPFRSVEIVETLPSNGFVVVDKSHPEALRLGDAASGSYRVVRALAGDVWAQDVCVSGGHFYVLGLMKQRPEAGALVHKYTLAGERVNGFGRPYITDAAIVRTQMSQALITCDDKNGIVLVMFKRLPYVYAYETSGTLRWIARVENFIIPALEQTGDAFRTSGRQTFDLPVTLTPLIHGRVLLQIARVTRLEEKVELHSYIINTSASGGTYVGSVVPSVVGGRWPRLIAVERKPYERIVGYDADAGIQ